MKLKSPVKPYTDQLDQIHSTDLVPYPDIKGETDTKKIYDILQTQNKQQQEMIDLLKK